MREILGHEFNSASSKKGQVLTLSVPKGFWVKFMWALEGHGASEFERKCMTPP
jgi:hypothetical protein